jgi:hypothetical protein
MKIVHRILLVGLIPLTACLVVVGFSLKNQLTESALLREMDQNVGLFKATSALVTHLQRERGRTSCFSPAVARSRTSGASAPAPIPLSPAFKPPCRPPHFPPRPGPP